MNDSSINDLSAFDSCVNRSELIMRLAKIYAYPDKDAYLALHSGAYCADLLPRAKQLFDIDVSLPAVTCSLEDYEAEYITLFLMGPKGTPLVSLQAGDYGQMLQDRSRTSLMLDYSSWYKHFGIRTRQDNTQNLQADNIICQMEFLAYLAQLEAKVLVRLPDAQADHEKLRRSYIAAQGDFLERQFLPFVSALEQSLDDQYKKVSQGEFFLLHIKLVKEVSSRLLRQLVALHKSADNLSNDESQTDVVKIIDPFDNKTTIQKGVGSKFSEAQVAKVNLWN